MDSVRNEVAIKRRIAYSSPQTSYAAWRSVGGAIEFISGFYADWDAARCDELLTIFALNPWQRISELSFGEVNKLGLLIALARDPDLLILDEPTTGLDPVVRQFLFADLLRRMQRSGQTILIATHQLGELERFADHVALMQQGKITLSGDVASLLERFHQINVALGGAAASPVMPGVTLLARSGDRAGLLVDREHAPPNWRTLLGCDIVTEQALTLEELFLGLVSPSGHRGMQEAVP
jgi:ABC-2 type transport system ATP-binding protein